jgi:hypothetical protein
MNNNANKHQRIYKNSALPLGIAVGVAIGASMDNISLGIAIGVALGAGLRTLYSFRKS